MSGRVASDEDFSERPAIDVVAGGALTKWTRKEVETRNRHRLSKSKRSSVPIRRTKHEGANESVPSI